jgi:hypothetical protein
MKHNHLDLLDATVTTDTQTVVINGVKHTVRELVRAGVLRKVGARYQLAGPDYIVGTQPNAAAPVAAES